jgi:lipopolysaccharide transport system ATP-binding protein
MAVVIKAENISKQYRLGYVGSGSIKDDARRWWAQLRGKEDPLLTVGETNDRSIVGETDYVWALKDINFEIEQGDTVGIIGRNGAGKSTLLKLLSKVTAPTTGNIKVRGRIASLLEVGTGFHGELTGRENIYLNGAIMGMRKHEITRKLDEIVDFAGVERYLDTPVKRYSSGMYVRLGFAVAAHLENEILIVDEVLAVGDAEFQKKCLGKMGDVAKGEGRTVLFVSHNLIAVSALCKSSLVMSNGELVFKGLINDAIPYYIKPSSNNKRFGDLDGYDRTGNAKIIFEKVIFFDENMNEINTPISGKKMFIGLKYIANGDQINGVKIGVAINNERYGIQLTVLANEVINNIFDRIPKKGVFLCEIPKLSIVSGQYYLNLFCSINDVVSDWLVNVCQFNIEAGDFYNTGKNMDNSQSQFLMEYAWTIKENI